MFGFQMQPSCLHLACHTPCICSCFIHANQTVSGIIVQTFHLPSIPPSLHPFHHPFTPLSFPPPLKPNAPATKNSQPPPSPHIHARNSHTPTSPLVYTSQSTRDVHPSLFVTPFVLSHFPLLRSYPAHHSRYQSNRRAMVRLREGRGDRAVTRSSISDNPQYMSSIDMTHFTSDDAYFLPHQPRQNIPQKRQVEICFLDFEFGVAGV